MIERFIMRLAVWLLFGVLIGCFSTSAQDAFEYSRGTTILGKSPIYGGFDALDLFGAAKGTLEPGNVIFSDNRPPGDLDYIEFQTGEEVPLTGVTFHFTADGGYQVWYRGTYKVALRADVDRDGTYETLLFIRDPLLYTDNGLNNEGFTTNFNMVITDRFRLEVTRYPEISSGFWSGPRLLELDAIVAPNPIRPTVQLTAPDGLTTYNEPAEIHMAATATDDGTIKRVEFYAGDQLIDTSTNGPNYTAIWKDAPGGVYNLRARGIDNMGAAEFSELIQVTIAYKPIRIEKLRFDEQGWFGFDLIDVKAGRSYDIYSSEDLVTWNFSDTFSPTSDRANYVDSQTTVEMPQRFYRVTLSPTPME